MKTIKELMKDFREGKLKQDIYTSVDEDGNNVIITYLTDEVGEGRLHVRTLQNNGWARIEIYHQDGTVETIYEK